MDSGSAHAAKDHSSTHQHVNAQSATDAIDHGNCSNESATDSTPSSSYPRFCRDINQFQAWQRSRVWLAFDSVTDSVRCASCSQIKSLGLLADQGEHCESAFVSSTVKCKDAKSLL